MAATKRTPVRKPVKPKDKSTKCGTAKCKGRRIIKWRGGQGPDGRPLETYACSQCGRKWPT